MNRLERIIRCLRGLLWCAVPVWIVFFMPGQMEYALQKSAGGIQASVAAEGATTRKMIAEQLQRPIALLERTEKDGNERIGAVVKLAGSIGAKLLDEKSGVLAIAAQARDDSRLQLASLNGTLAAALNGPAGVVPSIHGLFGAYAALPDRFYSSPEIASLRPEITCRDANGNGYGGCMRSRINGLLGEAFVTGAQITKDSPKFLEAATGIAVDVHTFTSKAVAPPTIKGRIWEGFKLATYAAGKVIP